MADRLISADSVVTALIDADLIKWQSQADEVQKVIDKIPTIEPKHGRWIWDKENDKMYCSECGYETDNWGVHQESDPIEWQLPNYCENCGARMEEVEE